MLALYAEVMAELRVRDVTRSWNSPGGDLAEAMFCKAMGWSRTGNSNANIDALGPDGVRYQIKSRRLTKQNDSRQLSAIRDLKGGHFDFLAGVLFRPDYSIQRAALVPRAIVEQRASFVAHTNSHRFLLRDDIWLADGVRDLTNELRAVTL